MRNRDAEQMVSRLITQLKTQRKKEGLSYEQLAERAGIHRTTISLIEREKQIPTILTCKKLANALEISLTELVKKSEN
jgi:transcriptional regulator with XRE-family HTH domain